MSIKTEHPTCSEVFSGRWHWNPSCHHLHRNQIVLLIFNNFSIESLVKKRRKHLWRFSIDTTRLCLFYSTWKNFHSPPVLCCSIFSFARFSLSSLSNWILSHFIVLTPSGSGGCRKDNTEERRRFLYNWKIVPCDTLSDSPKLPTLGGFCFHRKFSLLTIEKGRWSGASVEEGWRLERKVKSSQTQNRGRKKNHQIPFWR